MPFIEVRDKKPLMMYIPKISSNIIHLLPRRILSLIDISKPAMTTGVPKIMCKNNTPRVTDVESSTSFISGTVNQKLKIRINPTSVINQPR